MSAASKFPFQSFDENLCLNCSTQFVKDGVVQERKLTYLEVVDEGSIVKHEAISAFSALNYIFKLPLSNQIDEVHEQTFGCCPGCASLISRLYALHKKLDELSSINSIISNIVNMKMAVNRPEEPSTPCKAASSDNCPLSGSPNSTIQASPACALQLATNMNLTKNCPNCCVKLYSGPVNSICPLEARRAVGSAVLIGSQTESRTKITMSDVLHSILNFPQMNSMTQNINFCAECAPAILQIFKLYKNLKTRPESYLNFLFDRIKSWISTGLTSSAPVGLTTRITLMPNSRPFKATSSARATAVPVVPTIVNPNPNPRIRKQDKLDELSSINSVISNILNMKRTVKQTEEPSAPCKATSSDNGTSSGSPNSTIQVSPALALQLSTDVNLTKNCPNCYVKLYSGPVNSICPLEARRAVSSAVILGATQTKSRTTITMSDVLNSILNFPQMNSMTQNISFCVECAPAILQIFKLYINLKTRPESYLNFLFGRIQSWISTRLTSSAPVGRSTRIVNMPNSRTLNATSSVRINPLPVGPNIPRIRKQDQNTASKIKVTSESQSQPFEDPICESPMDVATVSYSDSGESPGHLSDYDSDTHQTVVDAPTRIGILPRPRHIIVNASNKKGGNGRSRKSPCELLEMRRMVAVERGNPNSNKTKCMPRITHDPCPHCGKVFVNRKMNWMKRHIAIFHNQTITSFSCDTCGRPCSSYCNKLKHAKSHLNAAERLQKQQEDPLPKFFSSEAMEKKRAQSRELARKRSKKQQCIQPIVHDPCPHCGKVFVNKNRNWMKYHIAYSHKHTFTNFCCDTCGRPCGSSNSKRQHAKSHLNAAERLQKQQEDPPPTFLCQECGKILMSGTKLKAHSRIHEDVVTRQLHCPEIGCDFTCFIKSSLEKHRSRVHDPTAVPKYKCAKCSQSFRLYTELKGHEMVSCDAHNRPFACDQGNCTRRFKRKQALVLHLHDVHKLSPAEAREKVYPGLDCPVWIGRKQRKQSHK